MVTVLFNETIFGPIHSRRLGTSLGVNLSPTDGKICSFDCIYCEAGYNSQGQGTSGIPSRANVKNKLKAKLKDMSEKGEKLDVITFSGNGEPTVHPHFNEIVADTLRLRDTYFPEVKVSVLSNATFINSKKVANALRMVDNCILKLDSANDRTITLVNAPINHNFTSESLIYDLKEFGDKCIIQTMFLRGEHNGKKVDNTTDEEVDALIEAYKIIQPKEVMIYSIDRKTPEKNLEKVPIEELNIIADKIRAAGINVQAN